MKTIIARFTEMKKDPNGIIEVDGEEVDVNRVDTALKSVGVSLKDTTGQFRDLDDVFMELAKKWDTLDLMQQRYVATTAAGSRQQSRFIAMMDNYDRTMELVDAANNSAGASNEQFSKTVDSLESKLNKLTNAWNEFTMGLANSSVIKTGVDLLTNVLNIVNEITGAFGDGVGGVLKFGVALGGLKLGKGLVNAGFGFVGSAIQKGKENAAVKPQGFVNKFNATANKVATPFRKETWVGSKKEGVDYSKTIKDLKLYKNASNSVINTQKKLNETNNKAKIISKDLTNAREKSKSITEALNKQNSYNNVTKTKMNSLQTQSAKALKVEQGLERENTRLRGLRAHQELTIARSTAARDAALDRLNITEAENEFLDKAGLSTDQKAILLSQEKTRKLTQEIIATGKLTDEQKEKLLVSMAENNTTNLGLIGRAKAIKQLLFSSQANRTAAVSTLNLATTEQIATGTTGALATAFMALPIGWIVAGIVAVVAAFGIYNAIVETNEEKLERLNNTSKELQEQLTETQEKLDSISENKEGLTTLYEELENLAEGTLDWKQKLIEVNQQVLDLIEKYPELAKYLTVGENGLFNIDERGWKATQENLVETVQNLTQFSLGTDIEKTVTQQKTDRENTIKNLSGRLFEQGTEMTESGHEYNSIVSLSGMDIGQLLTEWINSGKTAITESDINSSEIILPSDSKEKEKTLDIINDYLTSYASNNIAIEKEMQALSSSLVDNTEMANSKYASQLRGTLTDSKVYAEKISTMKRSGGLSKENKEEYAKLTGLSLDEVNAKIKDKSLSKATIIDALTKYDVHTDLEKTLKKVESAFKDLENSMKDTPEHFNAISALVAGDGTNLAESETKKIVELADENRDENVTEDEVKSYLTKQGINVDENGMTDLGITIEEFTNRIKVSVDSWEDIYNQAGKYGVTDKVESLFEQLSNGLNSGLEFTSKQATSINNILSQIAATGGNADQLKDKFDEIFNQVKTPEDLEKVVTLLNGTDWTATSSIEDTVKSLKDMGITCDDDLTPSLIEAAKASKNIDVNKLKESTKALLDFIKELEDREDTERGFSEEEYKELEPYLTDKIKADFVFDGSEYVYIGDSLQDLKTALEENTKAKLEESKATLSEQVERGEKWEDKVKADSNFSNVVDAVLSGEYSEKYGSGTNSRGMPNSIAAAGKLDNYLRNLGYDITASKTLEGAVEQFKKYMGDYTNLSANKSQLDSMSNPLLVAGTTTEDIKNSTETYEQKTQAINKLIKTTAGAEEKSKKLTKQFEKEGKAVDPNSVKLLAIELTNAERAIDKINSTISDYEDALKAKDGSLDYYAGIEELTKQAKIVFGENVDSTWVEENLENLLKLSEGGDSARIALEELYATEKAKKPTIKIISTDQADTQALNIFESAFVELNNVVGSETEKINNSIGSIQTALNDLNNSDVSFEVKADTKTALANLIKTAMVKAVVSEDVAKFNSLWKLALSSGLTMSGIGKTIDASTFEGKTTYTFTKDAAEKVNNIAFTNLESKEIEITPSYTGSGLSTNNYEKDKDKEEDVWENSYDRLYNLTEDINENLREREELERKYDKLLKNRKSTAADLYENYKAQLANLEEQKKLQTQMLNSRKQEIKNTVSRNSELQGYASYNWKDMTIEIDWNKINKVTDPELGERIEDYVSKLEELQDSMDEAKDAIADIKQDTEELTNQGHDEMVDFEQRIMDAIIDREEKKIEKLEAIDDSITDGNSKLLDSIQENLDKVRQQRENEEKEKDLAEKEAQLSYLQLDTSGANDLAIAELEKEIAEGQQDYTDTLIDQKLTELQEQNEQASEERQAQIEIMKAQLEKAKEQGDYWREVYKLISFGTDATGALIHGSELEKILQASDTYSGLSKIQKMDWLKDLEEQAKISIAQYSKENQLEKLGYYANQKITFTDGSGKTRTGIIQKDGSVKVSGNGGTYTYKDVYRAADGTFKTLENSGEFKKNKKKTGTSSNDKNKVNAKDISGSTAEKIAAAIWIDGDDAGWGNGDTRKQRINQKYKNGYDKVQDILNQKALNGDIYKKYYGKDLSAYYYTAFKTGGLADFTGPAWLDGTKSSPELVLNQQDTKNFLILKDVLSSLLRNTSTNKTTTNSGDNYFEINIQVDKLESDYDVDDLANKVKKIITDDSRYRNVNTINFLR